MFRNYLTVVLRNFARHKLYSFINIAGLTVGLACAIFIALFIRDELSYDKWVPGSENVYRVDIGFMLPGHDIERAGNSIFVLGPAMKAQIPEVTAYTHIVTQTVTLKAGDRLFSQDVDVVDPDFFQVIPLPLVAGDPARVFAHPDSIVLSQTEAAKLFGGASAAGKTVVVNGTHPMTVTGILKDLPHNTQLEAYAFFPNTSKADPMEEFYKKHWESIGPYLYVKLVPGSDPDRVLAMARHIIDSNVDAKKDFGADIPGSEVMQPHLTPFVQAHLSDYIGSMTPGGSWTEVYGFAAIAGLILLIACFNFTNLATARATMRAREVSLRKVVGAKRRQLITQFLGESVLTALLALILALALVEMLLPIYDGFLGRPIAFSYLRDWQLTLTIIAVTALAGVLAGLYPAFVLSAFRPAATLRSDKQGLSGSGVLRTGLVVLQFAISIGLGIAAMVVFAQIRYARQMDLGFNRSNIVVIRNVSDLPKTAREDFARVVATEPSVAGAALSRSTPFDGMTNLNSVTLPGSPQVLEVRSWEADPNYPQVYRLKLLAGRFLSRDRARDVFRYNDDLPANVVVSEAAARRFGYTPQQAIGKTLHEGHKVLTIVGVVTNQYLNGPQADVQPIVFEYDDLMDELSVRVRPGRVQEALAAIDSDWRRFAPNVAIDRHFLDEPFDRMFKADIQRGRIFAVFVGIAIFIACLGLFGLAAFMAERRTKEIGIRKAFGARTPDIVRLLLWQFSIPVLIANAIAWPVAWYYLHGWLESYAYRITLSPIYFVAAGFVALLIAWATVIVHAVRVARANPVHALHHE